MIKIKLTLIFIILLLTLSCKNKNDEIKVGFLLFRNDGLYLNQLADEIENRAESEKINILARGANGDAILQVKQAKDLMEEQKVRVLIVSPINRDVCKDIISIAKRLSVVLIFISKEPYTQDMDSYNKAFYVGINDEMAGTMAAEILADYFLNDEAVDKNNDSKIQYIILKGDNDKTTEVRVKSFEDRLKSNNIINIEKLDSGFANWRHDKAKVITEEFYKKHGDKIEVIFSLNDEMAFGSIDFFKDSNYFGIGKKNISIISIDGLDRAVDAIADGYLLGSVFNDYISQAKVIIDIILCVKNNKKIINTVSSFTDEKGLGSGRYALVPSQKISQNNFEKF